MIKRFERQRNGRRVARVESGDGGGAEGGREEGRLEEVRSRDPRGG